MNVLFFLSADEDGVAYHRLFLPSQYLENFEVRRRVKNIFPADMEWADVVVVSRLMDGPAEQIRGICDKYNVKLVVDVDDLWILPQNHILHQYYQKTQYGKKQEDYLKIADQVWTTNIRLADEIRPFNKNVIVIPNALPYGKEQFTDERTESDRVRFFYAGGHTHKHDINLLKDVNRELRNDPIFKEKGQFVLGGGYENPTDIYVDKIWADMEQVYSGHAVKSPTYKRLYGKGVHNYMELYREADVGLIPLEDNRFTRCKSNLKILECAAKKIPCIVSHMPTYWDNNPPTISAGIKQRSFGDAIKALINDPAIVEIYGQYLYKWAMEHHYLPTVNKIREEALKNIS
jgi:glycosyltransferase involved in cell wall biosynthesis